MRSVSLTVSTDRVRPADAYARVGEFGRYPDLVDAVRSVTVHPCPPGAPVPSDWAVNFRNGVLRWSEVDTFDPVLRQIHFEQTTGDFEHFSGDWRVDPDDDQGCRVTFAAEFDFGIPSLAGILDPIAGRVLRETIRTILAALLGEIRVCDDELVLGAA